jgi:hypothetical protein
MKGLSVPVLSLRALAVLLSLAGCGGATVQSPLVLSQGQRLSFSNVGHVTPAGKRKVGKFWLVWSTVSVPPQSSRSAYAVCPNGYVATGGGFVSGAPSSNINLLYQITSTWLNQGGRVDEGWVATATNTGPSSSGSVSEEADAICAPTT